MDPEYTFAARLFGAAASQIISVDVATGARTEHTAGPGLKVSPQFLSADRIGYLIKGPGQKGELAFSTGEHGAEAPAPGAIRNPAWSPDGKHLVYEKFAYDSKQSQPLYSKDQTFELRFSGEFPAISSTGRVALSPFGDSTKGARPHGLCRGRGQWHATILPPSNGAIPQLFASQKAVYVFSGS